MSSNSERGIRAQVEARYKQTQVLEKKASSLLKVKSPFDADVRALRDSIRDNYEAILLSDYEFAAANDVELNLWSLHYRRIAEFRQRINAKSTGAGSGVEASGQRTSQKGRTDNSKVAMQKLCAVFRSFLAEASGFYHNLIYKLRAKYGLPQDFSGFLKPEVSGSWSICQKSCHRSLIYLGDLARYKELHGDSEGRSQDWSVAAGYYLQAAAVWPAGGNPHNQLAVLASYVNDELLSAYHYFRSLAVEIPFLTARDNLIMQFEKNRQRFLQLPPLSSKKDLRQQRTAAKAGHLEGGMVKIGDGVMKLAVKGKLDSKPGQPEALTDFSSLHKSFSVRFVRLTGILFTKTSLEVFPEVYASTLEELEQLLRMDDGQLDSKFGLEHNALGYGGGGPSRFLQLVVMLIFTIENISWMPDDQQPSYAEILQRSLLYQHAFTAAFEVCGQLLLRCKASADPKKCAMLPALLVFLEWLSCHPGVVIGSDVAEQQANARTFFWEQMVGLLNSILDLEGGWNGGGTNHNANSVLWEDHELRGFQPIAKIQAGMDFSQAAAQANIWGDAAIQMRTHRFIVAGIAVASAAEELGKSSSAGIDAMVWKPHVGRFTLPGVPLNSPSSAEHHEGEALPDSEALAQNGIDYGFLEQEQADISRELEFLKIEEGTGTGGPVSGIVKELVPVGSEWLGGVEDTLGLWETPLEEDGLLETMGGMTDGPSDGDEDYEELEDGGANFAEAEEEELIVFRPVHSRQPSVGQPEVTGRTGALGGLVAVTSVAKTATIGFDSGVGLSMPAVAAQRNVLPSVPLQPAQHEMSSPWSSGILPGFSVSYAATSHDNITSKPLPAPLSTVVGPSGYSKPMGGVIASGGWGGNRQAMETTASETQSGRNVRSFGAWLPGADDNSAELADKVESIPTGVIGQSNRPVAAVPGNDVGQSRHHSALMQPGTSFVGSRKAQVDIPVPKPLHPSRPMSHPDYFPAAAVLAPGPPGSLSVPYSSGSSLWTTPVGQQRDSLGHGWNGGSSVGHNLNANVMNMSTSEVDGHIKNGPEGGRYGGVPAAKSASPPTLQEAWQAMQGYGNVGGTDGGSSTLASSRPTSVGVIGMQQSPKGGRSIAVPMPPQPWERDARQMGPASGLLKDFAGSQDDYGWLDEFSQSKQLPSRMYQGHGQQVQQLPQDERLMKLQGNGSSLWSTNVRNAGVNAALPPFPGMVRGNPAEDGQRHSGFSEDRPQWHNDLSRDPFVP